MKEFSFSKTVTLSQSLLLILNRRWNVLEICVHTMFICFELLGPLDLYLHYKFICIHFCATCCKGASAVECRHNIIKDFGIHSMPNKSNQFLILLYVQKKVHEFQFWSKSGHFSRHFDCTSWQQPPCVLNELRYYKVIIVKTDVRIEMKWSFSEGTY